MTLQEFRDGFFQPVHFARRFFQQAPFPWCFYIIQMAVCPGETDKKCCRKYVLAQEREGGGGYLDQFLLGQCAAGLTEPLPHYSLYCGPF